MIKRVFIACMMAAMVMSCATDQGDLQRAVPKAAGQPQSISVEGKGHVAFFFTAGMEYAEHRKSYADYIYYYEKAKGGLAAEGFTWSYNSRFPIVIDNGGLKVSLGAGALSQAAGYVLIKRGGRFRVVYGVYSDPDLIKMAREYFNQP